MKLPPSLGAAGLLIGLAVAPAAGQDSLPGARKVLTTLAPRLSVRLQFRGGSTASGRLALLGDTVSLYAPWGRWYSFGVDSVSHVWRNGPGHAGAGLKTGAIFGAALGAIAFIAVASAFCRDADSSSGCTVGGYLSAGAIGGLLGSLIGGVLGAIIAAVIPDWQPIYPAP